MLIFFYIYIKNLLLLKLKSMNKKIFYFFILFIIPIFLFGQTEKNSLPNKELRKLRPTYINLGSGLNYTSFRDFATSPLFYSGIGGVFYSSILKTDTKRETELGFMATGGSYYASGNSNSTMSLDGSFYFFYTSLYQLKKLSTDRFNLKTGGSVNLALNARNNDSFMNNGFGMEFIPTLFGSVKSSFDISRKQAKQKKWWFLKYKLDSRRMKLSYLVNIGLMNNSYRNGFIYNNQSFLVNDYHEFEDYVFKAFSGFRMNTSLDFTYFLKNKNALKITYLWDAYKTGGALDQFEFASHNLSFSLLFNTK